MFRTLREDIRAVFDRDPAARSFWEVLTCYPGIHALILHRLAHWLWGHRLRWLARFTAHVSRFLTGMGRERFTPAEGEATLSGVLVVTDDRTGLATAVEPVRDGGRLMPTPA